MRIANPGRPNTPDAEDGSFSECLSAATRDLHLRAERTGFIGDLLRRRGCRLGYALLIRNLLPVYQCMEAGLNRHAAARSLRLIVRAELYRSAALKSDLDMLLSRERDLVPPMLLAGRRYTERVIAAATKHPNALIAHAYVRYFGDISGGQLLKRLLSQSLGLEELAFYDFPAIADIKAFREEYRHAFNLAGAELDCAERIEVLAEAQTAFRANIDLSMNIQDYLKSQ